MKRTWKQAQHTLEMAEETTSQGMQAACRGQKLKRADCPLRLQEKPSSAPGDPLGLYTTVI